MAQNGQGPMPQLAVAICSDNRLFLESLERVVVSEVHAELALAPTDSREAGIVLLDAAADGALGRCSELAHSGRAVILLNLGSEACAVSALRAGARGVLERQSGIDQLRSAIRAVAQGQVWAPQGVVARALSLLSTMAGHSREEPNVERGLTRREREIMGHTVGGLSNREIADRMAIRTSTVKAHLTSVFRKLSVRDRTQLVVLYHHHSGSDQAARGASVAHGSFLRA